MPYKSKERQREYQRQWQRDRRASVPSKVQSSIEEIRTAEGMLNILSKLLKQLMAAKVDLFLKARTVAYVVSVGLKATEVAELERRLNILEDKILIRGGNGNGHKNQN
jgi:hypothetical protein